MFLGPHPGQKLVPVELRMKASDWERVKSAAAVLEVTVVEFCREALHQRSIQLAEFYRSRGEHPEGKAA